jgi:hypothetical protein
MSIETFMTALLETVCDEVSPDFAPFDTPRPYVTYQKIGGRSVITLDSTPPPTRNVTVQINVWADTRLSAAALMKAIGDLLLQAPELKSARPLSAPVDDFDSDIPVYGCRQDFSIWLDE